jgi:hypothetical protein
MLSENSVLSSIASRATVTSAPTRRGKARHAMSQGSDRQRRQLPLLLGGATISLPMGPNRTEIVELLAQLLLSALEVDPPTSASREVADEDA